MKNLIIFALIVAGIYFVVPSNTPVDVKPVVAQSVAPITYRHDPKVVALFTQLGLDYSKLNLINEPNPNMPSNKFGSFSEPNTIYLHPEVLESVVLDVISHEYIHYVDSQEKSDYFDMYMDKLYVNYLYERMATYRTPEYCPSGNCLSLRAETKAIACTELRDDVLGQEFIDWCNKYLPKRALLFN